MAADVEQQGRYTEPHRKGDPDAGGPQSGREGQQVTQGQVDADVSHKGVEHGPAHVGKAAQNACADGLQTVRELEDAGQHQQGRGSGGSGGIGGEEPGDVMPQRNHHSGHKGIDQKAEVHTGPAGHAEGRKVAHTQLMTDADGGGRRHAHYHHKG